MLHVLNGDVLASSFPSSIPGKIAIVRECLVDGPVTANSIDELIVIRAKYLSENYSTTEAGYLETVIPEFEKVLTATAGTQVYLWFEKDLFSQVNLWLVMFLLKNHKGAIYLVLPTTPLDEGFAEMNELQLEEAYRDAKLLTQNERHVLNDMWRLYQTPDVSEALTLSRQVEPELPFLYPAVQAWKDSIPHGEYAGKPKVALKEIASELNTEDFSKIYRNFQHKYAIYGFGDLHTKRLWEEMKQSELKK
jgi:hypothetical protein